MQPVLIGGSDNSALALQPLRLATLGVDAFGLTGFLGLVSASMGFNFNESNFDRVRGNTLQQYFASTVRTATASVSGTNYNHRGVVVVFDVTAASGTGGVTVNIETQDNLSGKFITLLAGVNITATGTFVYRVYPGLTPAANAVANDVLPRTFRIRVAHADGSNYTYTLSAFFIL